MTSRLALALLCVAASPAVAQRISIANFKGPGAAAVRNQLVAAVCDSADCVNTTKTTTGGKPDWKKAKKESVVFFVTGVVAKKGKSLDLQVFTKAGPAKARKTIPLEKGALSSKGLQTAVDLLKGTFAAGVAGAAVEPQPEPVTPAATTATAGGTATSTTPQAEPAPAAEPAPPPKKVEPKSKPKFLVIDVGSDVLIRKLDYTAVTTGNLRPYNLPVIGLPTINLKFYPLALADTGAMAGLGLEGGFAYASWIRSKVESGTATAPSNIMRIDGGLRFDIIPIKTFALAITPYVGVRVQNFTIGTTSDGTRIDGVPSVSFLGLRAGLALDVPIIANRLNLFGRFGVIPVFDAGEIISSTFFAQGTILGLEASAGLGVWFTSFLQLRASFEYTRYGMTFITQPTDTFIASGGADLYLGGNAALRFAF